MRFLLTAILLVSCVTVFAAPVNRASYSLTSATATTTSASALAENKLRNYLLIQNNGSVTVYVKFGSAHSGTEGVLLAAGGNYEPYIPPTGAVYLKSASSTAAVTIYEGN